MISVILTTYNRPDWLEKALWGYHCQVDRDFEIVVADDGSGPETAKTLARLRDETGLAIKHVWHEDRGFRKTAILNRAIVESEGDYLIFSDHDCIPREDFVAVHRRLAEPGYLLSGGCFRLPMSTSQALTLDDISSGRAFDPRWLRSQGVERSTKIWKLTRNRRLAGLLDRLTPTSATFNGHNASCWRSDALSVNGFDERMQYGGLDREFGERLFNFGVRSKQVRHRAAVLHLDHERGYARPESIARNREIRRNTRTERVTATPYGIDPSNA